MSRHPADHVQRGVLKPLWIGQRQLSVATLSKGSDHPLRRDAQEAQISVSAWLAQAVRSRADADQHIQARATHRAAGLAAADELLADLDPPALGSQRWAVSVLAELGLTRDTRG